MTNEQERAEFEAWAQDKAELYKMSNGEYSSHITRFAFEAYQAGCAAIAPYQQRIAELESQIEAIGAGGVTQGQRLTGDRRSEPVAKIDPNPPQLSIVWHDSPESIDRAMWEQAAIEAGVSYEDLIEGSNVGETEDGEVFEFTHEQVIEGMRVQGCWGFVDTSANIIHAWAAPDADPEFAINMIAHEIGHVTGEPLSDDIQEEMRAEQFGRVAALAYKLWRQNK